MPDPSNVYLAPSSSVFMIILYLKLPSLSSTPYFLTILPPMADYANIGTSTDNLFATLRFQLMSGSTLLTTGLTIFITIIIPCAAYIITPSSTRVLFEGIFKFLVESINIGVRSKGKWTFDDIPDMTGKVVIVTGGNTGTKCFLLIRSCA